ncbi:Gfo/Idh/MocA family protein [Streptomyces sp. NPDC088733]|uniref:Gfo/Idh/MocA family protein n=1 Tax=Streptomyces sp. NPDC088733 TaxID=3365880 RepID=UPI003809660F
MTNRVWKLALIGCGDAGAAHATTVGRLPNARLVAALDAEEEQARTLCAEHGGQAVTSIAELVSHRPDVVIVATGPLGQPGVVAELAAEGFDAGLLCEKPLATGVPAARRLLETAAGAGMTVAVNHQRRFGLAVRRAVEMARGGNLGRPVRVEGYAKDATLFDWGPHWIDIAHLVADDAPVTWVDAAIDFTDGRTHAGLRLEGRGRLVWEYAGGLRGQLECGADVAGQPLLRIITTDAVIEFASVVPEGEGWARGPVLRVLGPSTGWQEIETGESALAAQQWSRSLAELTDALADGRAPVHDGARAVRALEVCVAGYQAARTRGPVRPQDARETDIREVLGD